MTGRAFLKAITSCSLMAVLIFVLMIPYEVGATEPFDRLGLIIVSDLYPNESEVEKGCELKQYLIENGADPDHVIFLAPDGTSGSNGVPTLDSIELGFEFFASQGDEGDIVTIYISDHLPPLVENETHFMFVDGNIALTTVDSWLDDINCDEMMVYVGGNRSGIASNFLGSEGREVICSMGSSYTTNCDEFDLVRGFEDPNADLDDDNDVSFYEAYLSESSRQEVNSQGPIFIG